MKELVSTVKLDDYYIEALKKKSIEYKYVPTKELSSKVLSNAEIFNTYGSNINEDNVEQFKNVKWINIMSAGVDKIPEKVYDGKVITNASGIHKVPMAEYTIGLLLSYYKNLKETDRLQKEKEWDDYLTSDELFGKKAVILGTGNIAKELARLLKAFNVNTTGLNTSGRDVEYFFETDKITAVNDYLKDADIVVSILPSTNETRGLVDESFFKQMKEEAVFVNIGRGDLITDNTLRYVVKEKPIKHLFLDVFNEEPLSKDSFLYEADNITITPHASARTDRYDERASELFLKNVDKYNEGVSLYNEVSFEKGY